MGKHPAATGRHGGGALAVRRREAEPCGWLRRARWLVLAGWLAAWAAVAGAQNPAPAVTNPVTRAQDVSVGPAAQLAGPSGVSDFLDLGLNANSGYDTNVTGAPGGGGAWLEALSGSLEGGQERGPFRWALGYAPSYTVYRNLSGYDRLDQAGEAEMSWQLNPHWFLRLSEHAAYGRYLASPAEAQVSGSVTALNNFILTPFARQFSQQPTVELDYVANYRLSFFLRGGYLEDRFFGQQEGTGPALSDLTGVTGAAGFDYRLSRRTTLGLEMDYGNSRLAGGISRVQLGAALVTLTRVLSATARVTLFAGPQEAELRENLERYLPSGLLASNPALALIHQNSLNWTAGGTLTLQEENTAWSLTVSRRTADSGGLFPGAVEADQALLGAEHRFGLHLTAGGSAGYERMALLDLSPAAGAGSTYSSWVASAHLDRPLGQHWDLHAEYNYMNQTERGLVPFAAALGRQQVSLGVGYRLALGQGG